MLISVHIAETKCQITINITTTTTITLTPAVGVPLLGWRAVDLSFELAVSQGGLPQPGWVFAQALTATLDYTERAATVISDEGQLSLLWWSGASWLPAAEGCPPPVVARQPTANRLIVGICRAGWYTLYGPTHQQWFPYLMRHYNLERIP
mgnify:CR=1 FL=1